MDEAKLTLTVVTPELALVEGVACDEVTLPAEGGQIGILPGHTPLITLLGIGTVGYRSGSRRESVAVRAGFAEIANDAVRVLADQAVAPASVDVAAVAQERDAADMRRAEVVGLEQLDAVNADVAYAEARLEIAGAKKTA